MNEERKFKTDVTGQICENTDRIGEEVRLQEPQIGDIVAVFNCGAYTMSMASNYNGRLLPMELLISDFADLSCYISFKFSFFVHPVCYEYMVIGSVKSWSHKYVHPYICTREV